MKKKAWVFSGQGSQYYQMGYELYNSNSSFKTHMDHCEQYTREANGIGFINELFRVENSKGKPFNDIRFTNPALFSIQYSLAKTFLSKGIKPDCVTGFSLGEIVAMTVSGQTSLKGGLSVVNNISNALHSYCPKGRMLAILAETSLLKKRPKLFDDLDIAAINCSQHFIVSGETSTILTLQSKLQDHHVICDLLPVDYAFHSKWIDCIKTPLLDSLGQLPAQSPKIDMFSVSRQDLVSSTTADDIWGIIRKPFDFDATVKQLVSNGISEFQDLSPTGTAANFIKRNLPGANPQKVMTFMSPYGSSTEAIDNYLIMHDGEQ